MFKLLKNLKTYWKAIIVIMLLLCTQAWADLSLPDYTSKIVNVGIQAGGIENISPKRIKKDHLDTLLLFTDKNEEILKNYTLEGNNEYVLNDISKEEKENLDSIIAEPLMVFYTITSPESKEIIKVQILENIPENQKKIVSNLDVTDIIKNMSKEQINAITEKIVTMLHTTVGPVLDQAAIVATKAEYSDLGMDLGSIQNKYILKTGLKMLGIAFISMLCAVSIIFLSSRVAAKLGKMLRERVFSKILSFSRAEFVEFSTASLIVRSTNDIQQIQNIIPMLFRVVIYAPIMGFGGFIMVLTKSDNSMAYIIGITVLAIMCIVAVLFAIAMPKFKRLQDLLDRINLVAREILTGLPVIRAFNKEKAEEKRFDTANKNLMKTGLFVTRTMSVMMPLMTLVMNGVAILIIWVGAHKIAEGVMQVGDMMAFIQYAMHIVISFLIISVISIMLPRVGISAKRVNEVLEKEPSIKDNENPEEFDNYKKGIVEFKNVSFRYPDADTEILEDISFIATPGTTTAIIGSTGSGKSTVVNLIPRFYDVTGGELLVDGANVKHVSLKDLRSRIGYVPQRGQLLSGTIESNIKYGKENISDEMMEKSAKIAQAVEFINEKENKYQEEISQGGTNVSGGQKQRLSIARALAIDPEIVIFDDSFSALDFKTDSKLREELSKELKNKTIIIVAQRINTVLNADQIIVLEEGKMVGKGTHKELMENCDTYVQIATSQLSKEELENGRS